MSSLLSIGALHQEMGRQEGVVSFPGKCCKLASADNFCLHWQACRLDGQGPRPGCGPFLGESHMEKTWYDRGFEAGYEAAVGCCFAKRGGLNSPDFETTEQETAWELGYFDGYHSVDD